MKFNKIFGWFLLFLGIAIILFTIYYSFNIFTGVSTAPEIFSSSVPLEEKTGTGIQSQVEEMISSQIRDMLPLDSFSGVLNLISWSIFAGILIFAGAQISSLGIKLIKK